MTSLHNAKYHILAILTVAVWGTTFISTKVLINNGLTPHEIFFIRFVIAYIGIWFISPRRIFSENVKDELTLLAAGLTGGTLYFITENTALQFTQTTNVAFIICITPLITTAMSLWVNKDNKVGRGWAVGSLVALVNKLSKKYNSVFITRKVFFYGALCVLPTFVVNPPSFPVEGFLRHEVFFNIMFLSVLASLVCFVVWNVVLMRIGTIMSSNYLYLNPLFTTVAASIFLDETLTGYAVAGVILVMLGVYIAARKG